MEEHVDNQPLRQRVEALVAEGHTWAELATRCDAYSLQGAGRWPKGDAAWLKRRLGLLEDGGRLRTTCPYSAVVRIARGLGIDPVDVGV